MLFASLIWIPLLHSEVSLAQSCFRLKELVSARLLLEANLALPPSQLDRTASPLINHSIRFLFSLSRPFPRPLPSLQQHLRHQLSSTWNSVPALSSPHLLCVSSTYCFNTLPKQPLMSLCYSLSGRIWPEQPRAPTLQPSTLTTLQPSTCLHTQLPLFPKASPSQLVRTKNNPYCQNYGSTLQPKTVGPLSTSSVHHPFRPHRAPLTSVPTTAQHQDATPNEEEYQNWSTGGGLVHREATVHESARVEAGAVVMGKAQVAEGTVVGAGSVVGPRVTVGSNTILHHNVSLQNCRVGSGCVFHNGVSVGAEGFGFFIDEKGRMVKKPQPMGVLLGDGVEIGANSCVDRGSWRDTVVGDNTKIDNLVQIGHNVVIGRCCIICGQTGVGGSSTLGDYVVLAGQVGVADHVSICSEVRVGAKSGVTSDLTKPGDYAGYPAVPANEWRRQVVMQRRAAKAPGCNEDGPTDLA